MPPSAVARYREIDSVKVLLRLVGRTSRRSIFSGRPAEFHNQQLVSISTHPSPMNSLWTVVSQKLEFYSLSSKWGNQTSVRAPGSQILKLQSHLLPDCYVHDPNLLDALEATVKSALEPIYVNEAFTATYGGLDNLYILQNPLGADLSSEGAVRDFLVQSWLRRAGFILHKFVHAKGLGEAFRFSGPDTSRHQQPDIRGQLTIGGGLVDVSIIELKSEEIVRTFWQKILDRGERNVRLPWDGKGSWDTVDKILLKIAFYLVFYDMPWLCWTAASHLLVFRLVHHPGQKPYMVVSPLVQVDDIREPFLDPVDRRIGERWMICVVGCSLGNIAAKSEDRFHFHVNDSTSVTGDPAPTQTSVHFGQSSDSMTSAGESSGSEWTPQSGRQRSPCIDALLVFSLGELPPGLAAPLVSPPLTAETAQGDQGLPHRHWKTEDILPSTIPRLHMNGFLGYGSTGMVFSGSWLGQDVAVKVAESEESRVRLHSESLWYAKVAEREPAKDILPTFIGWFRHSTFDILVLSKEGSSLTSWDDLILAERLELFSMVVKLHQAGLRHGDLEPRNVLRSITGRLKLVDLSEASEHQCCWRVSGSRKRRRRSHFCSELIQLRRALHLDDAKGASYESGQEANEVGKILSYPKYTLSV